MLKFEFKKLWKKKSILFIVFASFFMAFFVNFKSNVENIEEDHPAFINEDDAHSISILKIYDDVSSKGQDLTSFIMKMEESNDYYDISSRLRFDSSFNMLSFEEARNLNRKSLEFLEFNNKYLLDNYIELSPIEKTIFDWALFEHRYTESINSLARSNTVSKFSTNLSRRIIYNSPIIFGLAPILIIGILSSDIFSGEFEEGQISLIYTQTIHKKKIVLAKFLAILSLFLLYIFFALVFMLLYAIFAGISIGDFNEIYQIYLTNNTWTYIKAYKLVFEITVIFLIVGAFFSSLFLFISKASSSKKEAVAKVISLLLISSLLTNNIDKLKNPINPFFATRYLDNILGSLSLYINFDGSYSLRIEPKVYFSNYIYILFFTLLLFGFCIIVNNIGEKKAYNFRKTNRLDLELKKYILDRSIFVYLLFITFFISGIFFIFMVSDKIELNRYIGENGRIKHFESIYRENFEKEKELKKKYLSELKTKDEAEINEALDFLLGPLRASVEKSKIVYENILGQRDSFIKNKSKKYYRFKMEEFLSLDFKTISSSPYYKSEGPSQATRSIYRLTYEEAIDKSEEAMINLNRHPISVYDEFRTEGIRRDIEDESSFRSHSGVYVIFRMLKQRNLDYILLLGLSLMFFSGFILDKDGRDSINLIYTQPINKAKYYIKRISISVIIALLSLICLLGFAFMLGFITEGVGDLNFPIVVHDSLIKYPMQASLDVVKKSVIFIPLWNYLLRILVTMFIQLFFLSSLMHIISIFTRNKISQILLTISICLGFLVIDYFLEIPILTVINPFRYLQASDLVDNSLMVYNKIEGMKFERGLFVLTVCGGLLTGLGSYFAEKIKQAE